MTTNTPKAGSGVTEQEVARFKVQLTSTNASLSLNSAIKNTLEDFAQSRQPVAELKPYAYAVYFPDQPCEELVHDLDELLDDLTNREHIITPLYDKPAATPTPEQAAGVTDAARFVAFATALLSDDQAFMAALMSRPDAQDLDDVRAAIDAAILSGNSKGAET